MNAVYSADTIAQSGICVHQNENRMGYRNMTLKRYDYSANTIAQSEICVHLNENRMGYRNSYYMTLKRSLIILLIAENLNCIFLVIRLPENVPEEAIKCVICSP